MDQHNGRSNKKNSNINKKKKGSSSINQRFKKKKIERL